MIDFDVRFLEIASRSNQKNVIGAHFWIVDVEKVYYQEKHYLKVYIGILIGSISDLSEINFKITYQDSEIRRRVYNFSRTDKFAEFDVLGGIIEMPLEYSGANLDLKIEAVVHKNILYDYSSETAIVYPPHENGSKMDYIKAHDSTLKVFPRVEEDFWQCSCGKCNLTSEAMCVCCGRSLSNVAKTVEIGINETFWNLYTYYDKFEPRVEEEFDKQFNDFVSRSESFGITREYLESKIDVSQLRSMHASLRSDHLAKVEEEEKLLRVKKRKKKRIVWAILTSTAITVFMFAIGIDLIKYGYAHYVFGQSDYETSEKMFLELGTLMDSEFMVLESRYQRAIIEFTDDPVGSITTLQDLSAMNHPGSSNTYKSFTYTYANRLLTQKSYRSAIIYFERLGQYSDAKTKLSQAHYEYAHEYYTSVGLGDAALDHMLVASRADYLDAKELYNSWVYSYAKILANNKEYLDAYHAIERIDNYLNANELSKEYRYLHAKQLMLKKDYTGALSFFSDLATYKDSVTQTKEATYQLALTYYREKNFSTAYNYFLRIKGYRDATAKANECEDILFPWVIDRIAISYWDDTFPATTDSSFSTYSDYILSFRLLGGKQNATTDIRVSWCSPSCKSWTYKGFSSGDVFTVTFSWTDPWYAPTGTYTFKVYVLVRGKWVYVDYETIYVSY